MNEYRLVGPLVADPQEIGKATKLVVSCYVAKDTKPDFLSFLVPTSFMPPFPLHKGQSVLLKGKMVVRTEVVGGVNHHNTVIKITTINVVGGKGSQESSCEDSHINKGIDDLEL